MRANTIDDWRQNDGATKKRPMESLKLAFPSGVFYFVARLSLQTFSKTGNCRKLKLAPQLPDNVKSISNMMSARCWRERRTFWPALVFWLWLSSFVFGFAASDALHSPNCPEQLALRAASHSHMTHEASALQMSALHVDASCPMCLLQGGAQGILLLALIWVVPLSGAPIFAAFRATCAVARPLIYGARGPPVSLA